MNLLCAEGLRGAQDLDLRGCLDRLDGIARHVKFETDRHLYRFREHPAEFNNLDGYFRMMMMVTVLQQDLGLHYNPERIRLPSETIEPNERFFANPQDVFIHGLIREKGTGTCSSMPVFLVAVGRRLGYPLKLVKAKGHLFARWDKGDETFNIEGTTVGFVSDSDNYYRTWPASFSAEEEKAESYLKSLTPAKELAVFLSIRGECLRAQRNYGHALGAFAQASYKDPQSIGYQKLFARAEREAAQAGALPRRQSLLVDARQLAIPDGPMHDYYGKHKARLQAMLLAGLPEEDIEIELQQLKAELGLPNAPGSAAAPAAAVVDEKSALQNGPEALQISPK